MDEIVKTEPFDGETEHQETNLTDSTEEMTRWYTTLQSIMNAMAKTVSKELALSCDWDQDDSDDTPQPVFHVGFPLPQINLRKINVGEALIYCKG